MGTLLALLEAHLLRKGYAPFRRPKLDGGNHVTAFWIYVPLDTRAPSKSVVVYGETVFDKINPIPHLWSRAKEAYRDEAYRILRGFLVAQAAAVPPLRRGCGASATAAVAMRCSRAKCNKGCY